MKNFQVAIDGPAGSGKSSVSKRVADILGFNHIDTGAMYRAVTLEAINRNINLDADEEYAFLDDINIVYQNNFIYLNGLDVSKAIRSKEVTNNVSLVSSKKIVREKMVEVQKQAAQSGLILMDGRDIGYNVLPNANVKIFLTASVETRALRRHKELCEKGIEVSIEELKSEIAERDYKDINRLINPLKKASDAIELDTTNLSIDEVCEAITNLIKDGLDMEKNFMSEVRVKAYRKNDLVTGTIVSVNENEIFVDINTFTEGIMKLDKYGVDNATSFKDLVHVGDTIDAIVGKVSEERIYLTRLPLLKEKQYDDIVKLFQEKANITVKVVKKLTQGLICDYKGFELFMPLSQTFDSECTNPVVRIIEMDKSKNKIIVSSDIIAKEQLRKEKQQELDSINVGDEFEVSITRFESFGAFASFNHVTGLIRNVNVSHIKFDKITDVLEIGQKVKVKVIGKENNRIDLSMKALVETPFEQYIKNHNKGDVVTGTVTKKLPFGLVLELEKNVEGFLHISEFSWNPNDNFSASVVIGTQVEVAILSIETDKKKQKINLSRKALIDNPWNRVDLKVDDVAECIITKIVPSKGVEVSTQGVDGFIQVSELSNAKISRIEDNFAVGDKLNAIVVDINTRQWILKLSCKKQIENVEREEFAKYMTTQESENVSTNLGDLLKNYKRK